MIQKNSFSILDNMTMKEKKGKDLEFLLLKKQY